MYFIQQKSWKMHLIQQKSLKIQTCFTFTPLNFTILADKIRSNISKQFLDSRVGPSNFRYSLSCSPGSEDSKFVLHFSVALSLSILQQFQWNKQKILKNESELIFLFFEILKIKASEVLSECINDDKHFIIYFSTSLRFEVREHLLNPKFLHV